MIGIYHNKDLDGWCCGALIKKKYPEATLIGFDYGNSFEDLLAKISPDDEVIMADVSLPMEQMAQLADHVFGNFTWIDHHASAIADYTEYMLKNFHGSTTGFLTSVLHDGTAACEGAWEYFFPDHPAPRAVELLGQYDTWRNGDKELWDKWILPFQFGMRLDVSSPDTFPMYLLDENVTTSDIITVVEIGETILKYQKQQNAYAMHGSFDLEFEGLRVLACNGGGFNSQAFESKWDEEKYDAMMPFKYNGKGWTFSLYTTKDIDLSVIAKKYGGGGHRKACGFQLDNIPTFLFDMGKVSDGYHTFDELYDHRITLYIQLLWAIASKPGAHLVPWRTITHSDGSVWDGWFILGLYKEPGRQITYHLPISRWTECEFAEGLHKAPDWDGHTSEEVLRRIKLL